MAAFSRACVVLLLIGAVLVQAPAPSAAVTSTCQIEAPAAAFESQVSSSAVHAQIWRLYQATFLRQPDRDGLDYWISQRVAGADLATIAYNFTEGSEFTNRYGDLNNSEFVQLVYRNVLCRAPDADGESYWTGQLTNGRLTRHALLVNFAELREYLRFTQTCHSIYPAETSAVQHCWSDGLPPLASATLSANGYRAFDRSVGSGSFKGVEVDLTRDTASLFSTGHNRCDVASINANWLTASEKDAPNPGALGLGVVDGVHVKNSSDRSDRGVFGLRLDVNPNSVVEVWPGDTLSADDVRLNSVLFEDGTWALESWHAAAELSPYLPNLAPNEIVRPNEWLWAAAGIPVRIDGQNDLNFSADYYGDPYTYQTRNHSFIAVDKHTDRLVFGATSSLDALDLLNWAAGNGYEDLILFDGGGSTEFNVARAAVVAGTRLDVPVWLGIGCS